MGRQLRGADYVDLGADPFESYYLAMRVIAMGDLNAVDLAQACHEAILREQGGLLLEDHLHFHGRLPTSRTWQGVYIDDHIITQVLQRSEYDKGIQLRDDVLIEAVGRATRLTATAEPLDKHLGVNLFTQPAALRSMGSQAVWAPPKQNFTTLAAWRRD